MAKKPHEVMISDKAGYGCVIPGARVFKLEISHESKRIEDFRVLNHTVIPSIRMGDNAVVQCMGGRHRAPIRSDDQGHIGWRIR